MQPLEHDDYVNLRAQAAVLEQDGFGDKVLHLADGTFLKLFRRKRLITSAAIWPYAQRFADNAAKLAALDIPCPTIIQVYRIPSIERDAVHYHPLPGLTLRQLREQPAACPENIREQFARFVQQLHNQGVYFRSLHLGNVVLTPDGELGLIDISDLKVYKRPLNQGLRKRNFVHMIRDDDDREWLGAAFTIDG